MEKKTPDDAQRPILNDEEFAAKLQATTTNAAVRRADERERADREHWWIDENDVTASQRSPTTQQHQARDTGRRLEEEERLLADNMVGMKATTEGTAGRDGVEPPGGEQARSGDER